MALRGKSSLLAEVGSVANSRFRSRHSHTFSIHSTGTRMLLTTKDLAENHRRDVVFSINSEHLGNHRPTRKMAMTLTDPVPRVDQGLASPNPLRERRKGNWTARKFQIISVFMRSRSYLFGDSIAHGL